MIRRRQFLGSMGGIFLAAGYRLPSVARAVCEPMPDRLNWTSDVIAMQAHDSHHRAPVVTDVSLRPGGKQMAVVGDDHFICIYDFSKREFIHNLAKHSDWIRCARYSPDGNMLVTAGNDRQLVFWNAQDYSQSPSLRRQENAILGIDVSPDSTKVATVGFDNRIRIYDMVSKNLSREIVGGGNDNHAVGFSSDGGWIAVGGRAGAIQVWDVQTGQSVAQYRVHRRRIRSLQFRADGKILSCGEDQVIAIVDPLNTEQAALFPRQSAKIFDVAMLDADLLATAGTDNHVNLWRLSDKEHVGFLKGHTGTVSCLDSDRTKIVSGGFDTQVRVWEIKKDFVASLPRNGSEIHRDREIK